MTLLHASHVQQVRGDELRRRAGEIRARCDGLPAQEIADRIRRELLNVLPLEAHEELTDFFAAFLIERR